MVYRYESQNHYFNVCRKILTNNGFKLNQQNQNLIKDISDDTYFLYKWYGGKFQEIELQEPSQIFTFLLTKSLNQEQLKENLSKYIYVLERYKSLALHDHFDGENYSDLYEEFRNPIVIREQVWIPDEKRSRNFNDNFKQLQRDLYKKSGVYFLYDKQRKLIYIGKSGSNLGDRLASSIYERKAYYFSYALTETRSDCSIYEMYYIAVNKPPLNVDGKWEDKVTVSLPDLVFELISPAYEEEKVLVNG